MNARPVTEQMTIFQYGVNRIHVTARAPHSRLYTRRLTGGDQARPPPATKPVRSARGARPSGGPRSKRQGRR